METMPETSMSLEELHKQQPEIPTARLYKNKFHARVADKLTSDDTILSPLDALQAVADDLTPEELLGLGRFIDNSNTDDDGYEYVQSILHNISPRDHVVNSAGMITATIGNISEIRHTIKNLDCDSNFGRVLYDYYDDDFYSEVSAAAAADKGEDHGDKVYNWLHDLENTKQEIQYIKEDEARKLHEIEETHNSLF